MNVGRRCICLRLNCGHETGATEAMRWLMLILVIVLIALWAVQGQRHHCYFGLNASYVHCLLGQEAVTSGDNKNE